MASQTVVMRDVLGLSPGVEPRNSDRIFLLDSRNAVFDSLGPKSDFGSRFITTYPLGEPEHSQGCRLRVQGGDRVFTFTSDSILEWRQDLGGWAVIYVNPDGPVQPYRWTSGYLNGVMYFCHPSTGMLKYPLDSQICQKMFEDGVPSQPISMCVTNGRVCIMDEGFLYWSGPSSGLDYIPRLGGAGFQRIADRVAGDPIMVMPYAKGALVFTTGGILRCEFTGDSAVFHFRSMNTEYRPINSFCLFMLDDNTVGIVDERGIFQTSGETPTPAAPLFNEFLIQYLQRYQFKQGFNVRVEWDDLKKRLYLSTSTTRYSALYEKAFVLYPTVDKWGSFDKAHYGILPLLIQDGADTLDYFGFVDSDGLVNYWLEAASCEIPTDQVGLNAIYPLIQKTPSYASGEVGRICSSSMTLNTVSVSEIAGEVAGYYVPGSDTPVTPNLGPLDAMVQLGLIYLGDSAEHDRMIEVNRLFIGSAHSGLADLDTEDWALIPSGTSDEDYAAGIGTEDFGVEGTNYVNHGLRLIGTVDGRAIWDSVVPEMVQFNRAGRNYSCHVTGVWHILELTAEEVGQAFHIRHVRFTATDGGTLL